MSNNRGPEYLGSLLIAAIQKKQTKEALDLLEQGADPNYYERRQTPLMAAVEHAPSLIKPLIAAGADVNPKNGDIFPLFKAIKLGKIDVVKNLMNYGVNVNYEYDEYTPLIYAIYATRHSRNIDVIRLLIDGGADVNKKNMRGLAPFLNYFLRETISRDNWDIFELFLEKGVDVNVVNMQNETALHILTQQLNERAVERILKVPGIKVNEISVYYETPLMIAVKHNSLPIVQLLLNHPDIDVSKKTLKGTALGYTKDSGIQNALLQHTTMNDSLAIKTISRKQANRNVIKPILQDLRKPVGTVRVLEDAGDATGVDSLIVRGPMPVLPEGLQYLDCSNNPIGSLPPLPSTLRVLLCANCGLSELPDLPDSLEYLDARNNRLKDIRRMPPKLYLAPISRTHANDTANILLEGNDVPVGFLNGYGSITEYSTRHVHEVIDFEGQKVYTMILPKGTLLFRNIARPYNKQELLGIGMRNGSYFNYPEYNVFFYPYPFVAENFMHSNGYLNVFELVRDVEVLMGVAPSMNSRSDRHFTESKYMTSCNNIPTGTMGIMGNRYDPCFTRSFSSKYPEVAGMFVLAEEDAQVHIQNDMPQRFWSKYRTNFKDNRIKHGNSHQLVGQVGVPEIILHPNMNRYDLSSPLNYQHLLEMPRSKHAYDEAWETVEDKLASGEWTIDLFTKMYVRWESASDEVKARCVPPEDPYKLHHLNVSVWKGGRRTRRTRRTRRRR